MMLELEVRFELSRIAPVDHKYLEPPTIEVRRVPELAGETRDEPLESRMFAEGDVRDRQSVDRHSSASVP